LEYFQYFVVNLTTSQVSQIPLWDPIQPDWGVHAYSYVIVAGPLSLAAASSALKPPNSISTLRFLLYSGDLEDYCWGDYCHWLDWFIELRDYLHPR
jgi:hypothetical protein